MFKFGLLSETEWRKRLDQHEKYVSSIPAEAREKVTEIWGDRSGKRAEYYRGKELVGVRTFHRTGELETETPLANGVRHGMTYRWDEPGILLSCEPYENGLIHGTAYQWRRDGRLIGSYTMEHGSGIDLWWQDWDDGSVMLSEAYCYLNGYRHGFEWHFYDGKWLSQEIHWVHGVQHGIERSWNYKGGLRRGYPRYYIQEARVTKRQYVKACSKDATLPAFRSEDNAPQRVFPPEVTAALQSGSGLSAKI